MTAFLNARETAPVALRHLVVYIYACFFLCLVNTSTRDSDRDHVSSCCDQSEHGAQRQAQADTRAKASASKMSAKGVSSHGFLQLFHLQRLLHSRHDNTSCTLTPLTGQTNISPAIGNLTKNRVPPIAIRAVLRAFHRKACF